MLLLAASVLCVLYLARQEAAPEPAPAADVEELSEAGRAEERDVLVGGEGLSSESAQAAPFRGALDDACAFFVR